MKSFLKNSALIVTFFFQLFQSKSQLSCGTYDDFDAMFNNIGQLHNQHLSNVYNGFTIPTLSCEYESAIDQIKEFNKSYFLQYEVIFFGSSQSSKVIDDNFQFSRYFTNKVDFISRLLSTSDSASLNSCVNWVNQMNEIDTNNKALFSDLATTIQDNLEGVISNTTYENLMISHAEEWLQINGSLNQPAGAKLTGYILTIALKSCQWWRDNPNAHFEDEVGHPGESEAGPNVDVYTVPNVVVPPVVALDAAGALVSSVVSSGVQLINNGSISWGQTGTAAVAGAVTGSTGVVGKIAKWIKSWF
jgi:hypothetical protein